MIKQKVGIKQMWTVASDYETVDVVLNNAGYGLAVPFEAASVAQIRRQFDTNVFGLMEVSSAVLPVRPKK